MQRSLACTAILRLMFQDIVPISSFVGAPLKCCTLKVIRRTANLFSRQGLQKWWPQGVDMGSLRISLHSEQVNSRSARSCSEACSIPAVLSAAGSRNADVRLTNSTGSPGALPLLHSSKAHLPHRSKHVQVASHATPCAKNLSARENSTGEGCRC